MKMKEEKSGHKKNLR